MKEKSKDPDQQDMVRDLESYKARIYEIKMQVLELMAEIDGEWISECCSAPMCGEAIDMGLCPSCMEHCEAVNLEE